MLAEFSSVPASCACIHSQDSWVLFWARARFLPRQRCWGAAIPLPHMQKESAALKNGLFSFASVEQWHWVCKLTSEGSVAGKAPSWRWWAFRQTCPALCLAPAEDVKPCLALPCFTLQQ